MKIYLNKINRQKFKEIMQELLAIKEDEKKLNEAFKKFEPDFNYISFGRYETLLVKTLKEAMNDEFDWIGYFLYEREGKFTKKNIIKDKNGKNLPLRNYDDLYNLIINK